MKAIFLRGGLIQLLICFAVGSLEDAAIVQADHFELEGSQLTPETPSPSPPPQVSRHRMTPHDWASWSATFDPLDELRTALHVMQSTWFQLWVGTWPTAIDWTAAVIDTYLVSALSTLSRALDNLGHVPQDGGADPREIENELNLLFAQNVSALNLRGSFSVAGGRTSHGCRRPESIHHTVEVAMGGRNRGKLHQQIRGVGQAWGGWRVFSRGPGHLRGRLLPPSR